MKTLSVSNHRDGNPHLFDVAVVVVICSSLVIRARKTVLLIVNLATALLIHIGADHQARLLARKCICCSKLPISKSAASVVIFRSVNLATELLLCVNNLGIRNFFSPPVDQIPSLTKLEQRCLFIV